jgi:hypothetical protein
MNPVIFIAHFIGVNASTQWFTAPQPSLPPVVPLMIDGASSCGQYMRNIEMNFSKDFILLAVPPECACRRNPCLGWW